VSGLAAAANNDNFFITMPLTPACLTGLGDNLTMAVYDDAPVVVDASFYRGR
jgi:hypothetical protein